MLVIRVAQHVRERGQAHAISPPLHAASIQPMHGYDTVDSRSGAWSSSSTLSVQTGKAEADEVIGIIRPHFSFLENEVQLCL